MTLQKSTLGQTMMLGVRINYNSAKGAQKVPFQTCTLEVSSSGDDQKSC